MRAGSIFLLMSLAFCEAHAACSFTDLAGKWDVVATQTDFWSWCEINIKTNGTLRSSSCDNSQGQQNIGLNNFRLRTNGQCSVTGSFQDSFGNSFDVRARLSRDATTIIGVGIANGFSPGTFTAVKH